MSAQPTGRSCLRQRDDTVGCKNSVRACPRRQGKSGTRSTDYIDDPLVYARRVTNQLTSGHDITRRLTRQYGLRQRHGRRLIGLNSVDDRRSMYLSHEGASTFAAALPGGKKERARPENL